MATDPNGNVCKTSCCVFNFYTQTVYNPNPPRLWSRFNYVCPCYPTNPCLSSLSSWKQSDKIDNSFICLSSGDDCTKAIAGGVLLTGIWYSTNGGKNWSQSTGGLGVTAGAILSLSSSSNGGNIAIAGILGLGLWYSINGGQSWAQSNITTGSYSFTSISSDGSKAIAGILYSTNGGASWNPSSLTPAGTTNFTSVSISSDGTNAVAVSNNELWYSSNGGLSWTNQFTLAGGSFSFVVISRDGMRAIAGGANGLYYSATGGQSWFPTNVSGGFDSASISSNGIKMVAGGVSGIWYSSNGGQNWAQGSSNNNNVDKVVISGDGKNAVAGGSTVSFGLLYSTDSGKTWTQTSKTNNNFPSIVINNDGTKAIAANFNNNEGLWYSECTEQIIPCSTDFDLLNERRKAEILKYKANSSNMTKKQQYANAASNRWLTGRKRSWATQTVTYTNPNTSALQRVGNVLVCNNNNVRCTLTSGADVPGKVQSLCYDPTVPLYNYKVTRTYNGGGGKYGLYGRVQVVSLSNFNNITTTFNDPSFDLTPPTSNSPGAFTYTSSNALVATISGITVTIVGMGTCIITATQAAYSNYTSGSISALLTVNKITTILSNFAIPPPNPKKNYGDAPFNLIPATSDRPNSDNTPIIYSSGNTSVAKVDSNSGVVTIVGVGSCTFRATQEATDDYSAGTATTEILTVNRIAPTIDPLTLATPQNYSPTPFSIPITQPTSTSMGTFTYSSSNTNVATIKGNTIIILSASGQSPDNCIITATQEADGNYTSGSVSAPFIVNRIAPTIDPLTLATPQNYSPTPSPPIPITKPNSTSMGAFTYTSDESSVAEIPDPNVNQITIGNAGTCKITATQEAAGNYTSSSVSASFTVNQIAPTISLSLPIVYTNSTPFSLTQLTTSTSPDGTFYYTSSNTNVATIDENTSILRPVAAGTTIITVSQRAGQNYKAGETPFTLIISLALPNLTWPFTSPQTLFEFPNDSLTLNSPTSNSDGPITLSNANGGDAVGINPTIVSQGSGTFTLTGDHIEGVGQVTIVATQAPTNTYAQGIISFVLLIDETIPPDEFGPQV